MVLLALVLLLGLRFRLLLVCGEGGFVLRGGFGPLRFSIYPRSAEKAYKKERKWKKKAIKEVKKESGKKAEGPLSGGALDLLMELLPAALEAAGRFRKKLLVTELLIHLNWGARDPADAAIGYGMANAALGAILSLLEANFRVKKTDTLINLDYSLEKPTIYLRANLSLSLMQALALNFFVQQKILGAYMTYRRQKRTQEKMTKKAVR